MPDAQGDPIHHARSIEALRSELLGMIRELSTHVTVLNDERDRRYRERFEAQEKATALMNDNFVREFHEHIANAIREAQTASETTNRAIAKAEVAMDKRLDGMNEFRSQLRDQSQTFATRAECGAKFDSIEEAQIRAKEAMDERMTELRARLDISAGKGLGQAALVGIIGTVVAILVGVIVVSNMAFGG